MRRLSNNQDGNRAETLEKAFIQKNIGVFKEVLDKNSKGGIDPPEIKYDDLHKRMKYESTPYIKHRNIHVGWLKLLLTEIQFLTKYSSTINDPAICVYAGSAPATKIPRLNQLFPGTKFILIDPNEHVLMTPQTHFDRKDSETIYIMASQESNNEIGNLRPDRMINLVVNGQIKQVKKISPEVIANNNIVASSPSLIKQNLLVALNGGKNIIYEGYMTFNLAKIIREVYDEYNHSSLHMQRGSINNKLYFISDIRLNTSEYNQTDDSPTDYDIFANTAQMFLYMTALKPYASMLKFRTPFGEQFRNIINIPEIYVNDIDLAKSMGYDVMKSFGKKQFECPKGEIYLQAFAGDSSTETRLYVETANLSNAEYNIPMMTLDITEFEEKLFYYNRTHRSIGYHPITKPYHDHVVGIDACGDCAIAITIFKEYNEKYGVQWSPGTQLKECLRQMNRILLGKNTLHGKIFEPIVKL